MSASGSFEGESESEPGALILYSLVFLSLLKYDLTQRDTESKEIDECAE